MPGSTALSTAQDLHQIINPDKTTNTKCDLSVKDKVYLTGIDDSHTEYLLKYSGDRIVGSIPSRPATTFTKNIVEMSKSPPPMISMHPILPIAGATIASQNTLGPQEMIPGLPAPILRSLSSLSLKDRQKEKLQKQHPGVPRFGKAATPLSTVASVLNSPGILLPPRSVGGRIYPDSIMDSSVDWERVVKRLHDTIEEDESYPNYNQMQNMKAPDSHLSFNEDSFEIKPENLIPHLLSMTGLKMKKGTTASSRPRTQVSISAPTRPRYRHFHTMKPAIPITSRNNTFNIDRMTSSYTEKSASTRIKLVSIKDRKFIEQLETLPVSSLLGVTGQHDFYQEQNRRIRVAQERVTGAKISRAVSNMIIKDRRTARFPEFTNPVGYPHVPQKKGYWSHY